MKLLCVVAESGCGVAKLRCGVAEWECAWLAHLLGTISRSLVQL